MSTMMIDEWVEPDFHQINLDIETHLKQERGYKLDAGKFRQRGPLFTLPELIGFSNVRPSFQTPTSANPISTPKDAPSALPVLSGTPFPRPRTFDPHRPSPLTHVIEKRP
jgi:hypothetical protein